MIGGRVGMTVAADLSANLFAAVLLVMIVLLAAPSGGGAPAPVAPTIEVDTDVVAVRRAALGPDDLVAHLALRQPGSPALVLDLHADRIEIRLPGRARGEVTALDGSAARLDGRLRRALETPGPVALFVFEPAAYPRVAEALTAAGRLWREISVPAALRSRTGEGGSAWSPAFLALAERRPDAARFRRDLAALLAGAGDERVDRRVGGSSGTPGATPTAREETPDLLERLRRLWSGVVTFVTLALAAGVILKAEFGHARRPAHVRPAPDGSKGEGS